MSNVETTVFRPPAPYPGSTDLNPVRRGMRNATSQIGSLPRAAYERDIWKPPIPNMPVFVMGAAQIKTVLLDEASNFPSGDLFALIMRPAWGKGMLLAQGDNWKMQRRAAAQAFRASGMSSFVPVFVRMAEEVVADWRARGFGATDLHADMKRLTFNIIIETLLSGADAIDRDSFRQSVQDFWADISKMRVSYVFRADRYHAHRPSLTSPHRATLIAHISRLVAVRRDAPPRGDLVDLLLAAQDPETGDGLSDEQLVDNILGFILAGYETTAAALTWTLYLASAHAQTYARLQAEIDARDIYADTADAFGFTGQVISESLRLYPPAFVLTRVASNATQIGDFKIKAGQRINIPIYAIHRRASVWPDPHVFDPGRFAPDAPAPARYTYMPFGAGPRICIGAAFARTEMTAIIATLLRHVTITPPARDRVWPETELALIPKDGLPVTVSPRP